MKETVSVIICAYTAERWEDLVAAVQSVQQQHHLPHELIIVIDHNPELFERAKQQFPAAVVVENREHHGAGAAKNRGAAAAQGSIVAFMDDDAVAAPDWLEHLVAAYDEPQVIGVGGAIDPLWPDERPAWFPMEFDWVVGCTYRGMPNRRGPIRNFIGANMSFRRDVFETVSFFSGMGHVGTRPFGGLDPDFCIRVKRTWPEHVLLHEPQARVFHRVSANRTRWGYFCLRCYNEGLSKSRLTQRVGTDVGLASERAYTFRTLPLGVKTGIVQAVREGDVSGLARAGAIMAGFSITAFGYGIGTVREKWEQSWPRENPLRKRLRGHSTTSEHK